ncbi:MAG: glycine cleavage system protein GcvH [Gaiellales bacterium]|nr:glycine cleavage system protein GcvH [Gaiellales bacterium]
MNPKDFRFHKEHDWVRVEGDIAAFGVTDYAQKTLGDIVYVELPEVGTEVAANDSYAEVESVKAVSDVISPLSGIVVEINEEAVDAPEIINKSPYDEGWLVRVRYSNPAELDDLMTYDEYEQMVRELET